MGAVSLSQLLLLYTGFALALLLVFLLLIARFYQRFSGERTYFRWFVAPALLFAAGVVRYASLDQIAGDALAEALMAGGGVVIIALCVYLHQLMTRNR